MTISSKEDAIEFVRFSSSRSGPHFKNFIIHEIFAVPDTFAANRGRYQATETQFKNLEFEIPIATSMIGGKVNVCHISSDPPKEEFSLRLDTRDIMTHLKHGDRFGLCERDKEVKVDGAISSIINLNHA